MKCKNLNDLFVCLYFKTSLLFSMITDLIKHLKWRMYQCNFYYKHIYPIECFFWPKHKTLRNSIPKTWCDSTDIYRLFCFAMIVEFVEEECDGAEQIRLHIEEEQNYVTDNRDMEDNTKAWIVFHKWLIDSYNYIKYVRPALENSLDKSYPVLGDDPLKFLNDTTKTYKEKYGMVDFYEKIIKDRDNKLFRDIIHYREYFWT